MIQVFKGVALAEGQGQGRVRRLVEEGEGRSRVQREGRERRDLMREIRGWEQ